MDDSLPIAPGQWEEDFETHPIFRTQPFKEGEELPPLFEAFRILKYETKENAAEDLAEAYKYDGNRNFKFKKYHWATQNYTKALEIKCKNSVLNAQLYGNRATAQYYIGNYKKALKDAEESKKLKPDYLKALQRGALCCYNLQYWAECIAWCHEGLNVAPDDKTLLDLKTEAEERKKIDERDKRKAFVLQLKKIKSLENVENAIKKRGISIGDKNDARYKRPVHPNVSDAMVHLKSGRLIWPVIFIYPEYGTTDYIREFIEDSSFMEHLNIMFDPNNPPGWDANHEYVVANLQLYFTHENFLVPFDKTKKLREILSHYRYTLHDLTPCFNITVRGSDFDKHFRDRHTLLTDPKINST